MDKEKILEAFVVGIFAGGLFIGWPLLLIWSANTLFGWEISYSLKTWLAALVIILTFAGGFEMANS